MCVGADFARTTDVCEVAGMEKNDLAPLLVLVAQRHPHVHGLKRDLPNPPTKLKRRGERGGSGDRGQEKAQGRESETYKRYQHMERNK